MNRRIKLIIAALLVLALAVVFGVMSIPETKPTTTSQGTFKLIEVHPSDPTAFVEGAQLIDGKLYVSTGLVGESRLQTMEAHPKTLYTLPVDQFGEGFAAVPSGYWIVTWRNGVAHKLDKNFKQQKTVKYEGEGWGLSYQPGEGIWMSNGTGQLVLRDPETFKIIKKVSVHIDTDTLVKPQNHINELESVGDYVYANIWLTNRIVKIQKDTGLIEREWDMSELLPAFNMTQSQADRLGGLNGIAHVSGNRFLILGKKFPKLAEVELN